MTLVVRENNIKNLVRVVGLEPTLQRNWILNPARLPIPPHPRTKSALYKSAILKRLQGISAFCLNHALGLWF